MKSFSLKEASQAFMVIDAVVEFLDAYIENRVEACHVKRLASNLDDLENITLGSLDFSDRADELFQSWKGAKFNEETGVLSVEDRHAKDGPS